MKHYPVEVSATARVLGIDVGTSAAKAALWDPGTGQRVVARSAPYRMRSPAPGWWEQDPEDWLQAIVRAVTALRAQVGAALDPDAVALSGQMHGAVLTAADGRAVRPAILWPDQRAAAEATAIAAAIGAARLEALTGSPATPNYLLPKLLWLARHEPAALHHAAKVLLPKDWVRFRLGGGMATEPTDASGTGMMDLAALRWEPGLLAAFGLPQRLLPDIVPSAAVTGRLAPEWAGTLGLPAGIPLVAGAGDLPAAVLAAGARGRGGPVLNVGSAGQVALVIAAGEPRPSAAQAFAHPDPGLRIALGALLAAGLAVDWARKRLGGAAPLPPAQVPALLFVPHLAGERIPSVETRVRGAWVGLGLDTTPSEMVSAAIYGVALGVREVLEHMGAGEPHAAPLVLAEGAPARDWAQRLANALGREVGLFAGESPSALGACLLAAVSAGAAAWETRLADAERVPVEPGAARRLTALYRAYRRVRPALAAADGELAGMGAGNGEGDSAGT